MLGYRIDSQMSLYLGAVLEYIAADILKVTTRKPFWVFEFDTQIDAPQNSCQS